jgi:hypothetical protein
MSKFKDYRSLNGSNSRVTKKSRSITSVIDVMVKSMDAKRVITVRKSDFREPAGRIVPRNLTPVELLFETMEEQMMYIEFCKAAGK